MLNKVVKKILHSIRVHALKINNPNIQFGRLLRLDYKTNIDIRSNSSLIVGDNVYLRSNSQGYHVGMSFPTTILIDWPGAECRIGNNCRINGAYIHAQKKITIGENVVIAAGVNIIDSNGHKLYSQNRTIGRDEPAEIIIKNNVWVGLNSIILKGSVIGNNCVVAAGSVVKGHYPDNVLIQGNPAKVVKNLGAKL